MTTAYVEARTRWQAVVAHPARVHQGRNYGSTQPLEVQAAVRDGFECGMTVNAIALWLGISHDAVRVVRDGRLVRQHGRSWVGRRR